MDLATQQRSRHLVTDLLRGNWCNGMDYLYNHNTVTTANASRKVINNIMNMGT